MSRSQNHHGAEKADRTKPMNVEADALRYDDLRQTSVHPLSAHESAN